ncbi:5-oxoprolinase [Sphingobacterium sp. DK4209]|uniref:5-oxoprolinase n=1 Tax=Sphingobacterium zhuxiongii TaxID=2662364 RepID=A0A5Q0QBJ4_9SPHI|nr:MULTISPECIES: 5-oxoprolinase [unclassified Sphingobacterium]MVZ67073.1 5-oxoprolinase [Sphingobacterium sp. DK4209]QGA26856.1 5-oxoprolinase [Sphingobacterium sp. dk4302]
MSNTKSLQQHLAEQFHHYSTQELVVLNNDIVESYWGQSKSAFRSALLSALSRRGIDLSAIISKEDGITLIQRVAVKLEENRLIVV